MKKYWQNKKVLVTGGSGFIGSFISEYLINRGAKVSITALPNSSLGRIDHFQDKIDIKKGDLMQEQFCKEIMKGVDIVFHLASLKNNIRFQKDKPANILKDNTLMTLNLLDQASKNKTLKKIVLFSSGIVSLHPELDFNEAQFGYGWSKKIAEVFGKSYSSQYNMDILIIRPQNTFGPRDDFKTSSSQIIPAFIKRVVERDNPFLIWGDGSQKKSFVYVKDVAKNTLDLIENNPAGFNIVDFAEKNLISVLDLAKIIMDIDGAELEIKFDKTKPTGQDYDLTPKTKCGNFIYKAEQTFKESLEETISWFKKNIKYKNK